MKARSPFVVIAMTILIFSSVTNPALWADEPVPKLKLTSQAWTLPEAQAQFQLNLHDPYLQYISLQLARQENSQREIAQQIGSRRQRNGRRGRRDQVDLFKIFSGALAVQESLQLDTMTQAEEQKSDQKRTIDVTSLKGPTVKSHPWHTMLDGRNPKISPLSLFVPEDQYFVTFKSLNKLLDVLDLNDRWGAHVIIQTKREARNHRVSERLKTQLAIKTDPLTRPFYDLVVDEVAVTGSDLYVREGSDVTLLFQFKQSQVFKFRMDGFLDSFEQSIPKTTRTQGEYLGVKYDHLTAPERRVHVFSAYPKDGLHIRSNSLVGLQRVLEAVQGKTPNGKKVNRLGESEEFKYIRTLMPRGSKEEDGFVYLSDPFIRHLTGPKLKLTERRRMLAYNHMRMIGHAAMLHQTQFGQKAKSLTELATRECAPGVFGQGYLSCPSGGTYSLSQDGWQGVSSVYGHPLNLIPCCEIPVTKVTPKEAEEYKQFIQRYEQYWRTFFDPIAIRIQVSPERYRFETIVLPLINNSIYTGLTNALGGDPEPLDDLPVPDRNIFTIALKANKSVLLKQLEGLEGEVTDDSLDVFGISTKDALSQFTRFVRDGVGSQVAIHVYDATPTFDFNLTGFLGEMLGSFNGSGGFDDDILMISLLITSLNSPVYVSLPIEDPKIVDEFLELVDTWVAIVARQPAGGGFFVDDHDFYKMPLGKTGRKLRGYSLRFGPIKWRFFWARIGDGLYMASKPFIIDDLLKLHVDQNAANRRIASKNSSPKAHAMVRIRARNWKQILPHFQLGWSENSREAGLNNLSMLSNVARAYTASTLKTQSNEKITVDPSTEILRRAEAIYGCRFFCPEGGRYILSPDGKSMISTAHGTVLNPLQSPTPSSKGPLGRAMQEFAGATAELSFLEDGLHAVMTIERK